MNGELRQRLMRRRDSWRHQMETIDKIEGISPVYLAFWNQVRPLMKTAFDAGRSDHFLVGTSHGHIIFSTVEWGELELLDPPPLRVTLAFDDRLKPFVAISRANIHFNPPDRKDYLVSEKAYSVFESYLDELWKAAHPDDPLPWK